MILINWNKKNRKFSDIETMMRKLKLTSINEDDIKLLKKESNKGNYLFGTFNPYESEMSNGETISLLLSNNYEELMNTFYYMREEI